VASLPGLKRQYSSLEKQVNHIESCIKSFKEHGGCCPEISNSYISLQSGVGEIKQDLKTFRSEILILEKARGCDDTSALQAAIACSTKLQNACNILSFIHCHVGICKNDKLHKRAIHSIQRF
jgi:hypothetical protein